MPIRLRDLFTARPRATLATSDVIPVDGPSGDGATTYGLLKAQLIADADGAIPRSQRGAASGVATLDAQARIPLSQLPTGTTGALSYIGLVAGGSVPATAAQAGAYYVISTAGTSQSKTWAVGDQAIYSGTSGVWHQITPTALSIAQGGTGASTAAGALSSLGAASAIQLAEMRGRMAAQGTVAITQSGYISYGLFPAAAQIGASDCTIVLYVPQLQYVGGRTTGLCCLSPSPTGDGSALGIYPLRITYTAAGALRLYLGGDAHSRYYDLGLSSWHQLYAGRPCVLVLARTSAGFRFWTNGVEIALGTEQTTGTPPAWTDPISATYAQVGRTWSGDPYPGRIALLTYANRAWSQADVDAYLLTGLSVADRLGGSMLPITAGPLTIGARYRITTAGAGDTFAAVGAAAHTVGHEFVATAATGATWSNGSVLLQVGALIQPEITRTAQVLDHGPLRIRGTLQPGAIPQCDRAPEPVRATVSATGFFLGDLPIWFEPGVIKAIRVKPTGASAPTITVRRDSAGGAVVAAAQSSGAVGSWAVLTLDPAQVEVANGTKIHVTLSTAQPVDLEIEWSRR